VKMEDGEVKPVFQLRRAEDVRRHSKKSRRASEQDSIAAAAAAVEAEAGAYTRSHFRST